MSIVKARPLFKVLKLLGFVQTHKKGSHFFFSHPDSKTMVVPVHLKEDLGKGLLRAIMRDSDTEISVDKLNELLKK